MDVGDKGGLWLLGPKIRPGPVAEGQDYVLVCGSLSMGASSLIISSS